MLTCRKLVDRITQDPDLLEKKGSRSGWSVRLHLLMCRHCRRYMRQLRQLLRFLSVLPQRRQAPSEQVEKVWHTIEQRKDDDS